MRTLPRLALLLAATSLSAGVSAGQEQGFYVGGNYMFVNFGENVTEAGNADMGNLELVGGYKYRNWAGVEVRVGGGVRAQRDELGSDAPAGSVRLRHEIEHYQSIYYRAEVVNDEARLYVLAGYTSLELESSYQNAGREELASSSRSVSGASYGIGVGFKTENNVNINVEYKLLIEDIDEQFVGLSVGFDYRF